MCSTEQLSGPGQAIALLENALDYLNGCDIVALPTATQAELLRGLERVQSRHTAACARALSAFAAQRGHEDDGQHSPRVWLKWQTQVTTGAAAAAVAWSRRLGGHPVIGRALAGGGISTSWARLLCAWSDRLPAGARDSADEILCTAAAGGASLAGLAGLAEEIYQRTAAPTEDDDGFDDRHLRLGITFRGAGRVEGDLTPQCSQALSAVLDALGRKAGPEDSRTAGQRRHDALEEACRRLIASGMLPARGGQPTQVQVHISLGQLRGTLEPDGGGPGHGADGGGPGHGADGGGPGHGADGGEGHAKTSADAARDAAEAVWAGARATQPGWLTGPPAEAAVCDATIVPVVTGHVDWAGLDRLTGQFLADHGLAPDGSARCGCTCGGCCCPGRAPLSPRTLRRLRAALLALAADALSGPGGLAARLRAGLEGAPLTSVSLPLDIGAATETIPAHLRRAVTVRHRHCAFPGCGHPARACDIHHVIPRSRGGPTSLGNLVPLCTFHHLIVIHRWGWALTLNPDGTTTATSPDGRTLHSHGTTGRAA